MKRALVFVVLFAGFVARPAPADTHVVQVTDIGAMHFESETWMSGSRLRTRSVEPATIVELVIDTAVENFILADGDEREFVTMKYKVEKQVSGIAKIRQKAGNVTAHETGAVQRIGDWTVTEYRVEQAKSFAVSVWVARDLKNEEWLRWTRDYPSDEMSRRWDPTQLGGVPVKMEGTMIVSGMSVPFTSTLTKIDTAPIDPALLELPKTYEKSKWGVFHSPGTPDKKAVLAKTQPH